MALQQQVQRERIAIGPVRQQHDVLAVVSERLGLARLDDERAVEPRLLLERRVRVIPIRAALPNGKR